MPERGLSANARQLRKLIDSLLQEDRWIILVHSAQYSKFAAKVRKNLQIRKLIRVYFPENAFFMKMVVYFRFFAYLCKQNKVGLSIALA